MKITITSNDFAPRVIEDDMCCEINLSTIEHLCGVQLSTITTEEISKFVFSEVELMGIEFDEENAYFIATNDAVKSPM